MKRAYVLLFLSFMTVRPLYSQDTVSASGSISSDIVRDTAVTADSLAVAQPSDTSMLVVANNGEKTEQSDRTPVDVLIDLGIGVNLTKFFIKPDYISTDGKPRFMFNAGVEIPVGSYLYAAVAVQYLQISSKFSHSDTLRDIFPIVMQATTNFSNETHTYVSVPIKAGIRFGRGFVIPYFYGVIEPAFLGSSHQLVSKEVTTLYADSSLYYYPPKPNDIKTTKYRQRYQVFAGAGVGAEISYGYGYIFLDAGARYSLRETDTGDHPLSVPKRTESMMLYFPISLGIRFYL